VELTQSRIVTDDVRGLAGFYADLVRTPVVLNDYYVEVPTAGMSVGFSKCQFTECSAPAGQIGTIAVARGEVILDFRVTDLNATFTRVDRLGVEWVLLPTRQLWGARAMVFRDPEGTLINVYSPTEGNSP
jgi:catechol 2,3-dioxygenase-like lactoylglutathione lyase family enzyme